MRPKSFDPPDDVAWPGSPPAPRRRLHTGVALGVILWWLYFPFLGLLGILPHFADDWKLPVFVAALPGALAAIPFHHNEAVEALAAGGATVILIVLLTLFGRRGYVALTICSVVAFLMSTVVMVILNGALRA